MIVSEFRMAMLVNFASRGRIAARPMTVANHVADSEPERSGPPHRLSFVTRTDSRLASELQRDDGVCVTMQDGGRYVVMHGFAELSACGDCDKKNADCNDETAHGVAFYSPCAAPLPLSSSC